jgi:hypothetical protein
MLVGTEIGSRMNAGESYLTYLSKKDRFKIEYSFYSDKMEMKFQNADILNKKN